jgi:hypothetical protein
VAAGHLQPVQRRRGRLHQQRQQRRAGARVPQDGGEQLGRGGVRLEVPQLPAQRLHQVVAVGHYHLAQAVAAASVAALLSDAPQRARGTRRHLDAIGVSVGFQ